MNISYIHHLPTIMFYSLVGALIILSMWYCALACKDASLADLTPNGRKIVIFWIFAGFVVGGMYDIKLFMQGS